MRSRIFAFYFSMLSTFVAVVPLAQASAQAITEVNTSCGYDFQRFEIRRLLSYGWVCTPEHKAVAERMIKRGFSSKQYVDAYAIYRDIPRLAPAELETVAALHLVDINPQYFYSVDKSQRITPMQAYNKLHTKRGRPLAIVGFSLAAVGAALATVGMVRLLTADSYTETPSGERYNISRFNEDPLGASFAISGFVGMAAGVGIGSLGLHKLRMRSNEDVIGTMSMQQLAKRRCKVHHFTPEQFYYDLYYQGVRKPSFIRTSMLLNPKLVAVGVTVSF